MLEFNNPFRNFCMQLGNLPASYVESTTYQELLYWLCNFLEKEVIPTLNEDIAKAQELEDLFNQLQEFVNTYFDNLDVQEEINNKLDTMAQDGTLSVIISSYLAPIIENQNNKINQIDTKVNSVASGTPRGAFATEQDLINADPSHEYIYLVSNVNKWYYHNGTNWVAGATYLAGILSDNSVKFNNINPAVFSLLNANYVKIPTPTNGNIATYKNENGTITAGSSDKRYRFTLNLKSGILIKLNNPNNLYKYAIYTNPAGLYTPVYDSYSLADYNSSMDTLLVNGSSDEYTSYRIVLSFADDRDIRDNQALIDELISAFEIYQPKQEIYSNNIIDKTISYNKLLDVKSDNEILPYEIINVACSGETLTYTNSNFSFLIPVQKNKNINILINGKFNRCQYALLNYTPDEIKEISKTSGNTVPINIKYGKKLTKIDEILTPHKQTINTEDYNYLLVYYYHTSGDNNNPHNCNIALSYENIDNNYVEPFEIDFNGLKKTDSNYKIFDKVKRNLIFQSSAYNNDHEMQGICTDGTYLYYSMHGNTDDDTSVIGKIRISDFELVKEVNEDVLAHVNDICYYPRENCLFTVDLTYSTTGHAYISKIDPETLKFIEKVDLTDKIKDFWEQQSFVSFNGVAGITYVEELDIFVVLLSPTHQNSNKRGFAILNKNFELLKILQFSIDMPFILNKNKKSLGITGTVGCIDADENYIYLTLVYANSEEYGYTDIIQIYDYHGNLVDENIILSSTRDGIARDFIEGILMMKDGTFYTSNASDRICRYDILNYKHVPLSDMAKQFNFN